MKTNLIYLCASLSLLLICTSTLAQTIPDFLVNEQGSIDGAMQETPYIDGDGSGSYVVCWKDKRNGSDFDIYAQMYLNDSTPSGLNFKVNDDTGDAWQYRPTVTVDPNMNFVITWIDKRNGNPNHDWEVWAQRFSSDGTALGNNFKVSDDVEMAEKDIPSISIDSAGNFVVIWIDKRKGDWDIYCQRYLNDGTAVGPNFRVNDDVGDAFQSWPCCMCHKDGSFVVSWIDTRNNDDRDVYAQLFSADGTTLGDNFKVNTDAGTVNQVLPDIAMNGIGDFIIVWEDKRNGYFDIYAQRYLQDGTAVGDNFNLNEDTPDSSQGNPSVSMDEEGNFTACWEDKRNDYNDVYARRFSNEGIPLGDDFIVNTDNVYNAQQLNPVIASDAEGNFMICWEDHRLGFNGEIFKQNYFNDGTTMGENSTVNDDVASENQKYPSIAIDGSENFIIAWADDRSDGRDIYAQRFTDDGIALGNDFKVNDDTGENWTSMPSVATNPDGSFVIAWSDPRFGDCPNIFAQRYTADGTPLGSNFRVSYLSAAMNYNPRVVCKPNGDFIICWSDGDEGGKDDLMQPGSTRRNKQKIFYDEPDVWAQQFLSDGTPIGENFRVNDNTVYSFQQNSDIAVDGNGNFVICWDDNRSGFYEIYLQRYLTDGTPLGSNFKVEDAIYSDWELDPSVCMDDEGNFRVAWRDARNDIMDIFCRQFDNSGTATGPSFQVNTSTETGYRNGPCISANTIGDFIVTWTDETDNDQNIIAQQFLSDDTPYGTNFVVSNITEKEQSFPSVALSNNRIFTTWHDNHDEQTGFDVYANVKDWDFWVGINENSPGKTSPLPYLHQNYPNPFCNSTTIKFDLPEPVEVKIEIYNQFGQKGETILDKRLTEGLHEIKFEAGDLPGGVYFCRFAVKYNDNVGDFVEVKQMVILR